MPATTAGSGAGLGSELYSGSQRCSIAAPSAPRRPNPQSLAAPDLCRVVAAIHARGWCLGTGGNFSVALHHDPVRLLMTRSGCDKRALTPEDLLVVGPDGLPLQGETGTPSAEAPLHAAVASLRSAGSILHTHSVWGTLLGRHHLAAGGFAISGFEMLKGLEGVDTHTSEAFVPVVANSQDMRALAREVERVLTERPRSHGFLIAGHGLYTWGASLEMAHRHVEIFEFLFDCVGRTTDLRMS